MTVHVWRGLFCIMQTTYLSSLQVRGLSDPPGSGPWHPRPLSRGPRRQAVPRPPKSYRSRPRQLRETRVDKAAAATLTMILEHQCRIPMPSLLHPMALHSPAPTSRPRLPGTTHPAAARNPRRHSREPTSPAARTRRAAPIKKKPTPKMNAPDPTVEVLGPCPRRRRISSRRSGAIRTTRLRQRGVRRLLRFRFSR